MRALDPTETQAVIAKLASFSGKHVTGILENHVIRLHRSRVFLVKDHIQRRASSVSHSALVSLGTCIGRFTKTGKFKLAITCLDLLHCDHHVSLKQDMSFIYGNHVIRAHATKHNLVENKPCIVKSQTGITLGFGVASSNLNGNPTSLLVLNQADIGLYLRQEDEL